MKYQKVLVQFSAREEAKALPVLLRHSPGMVLPDRKYLISADAVQSLRQAGISFTEVGRETEAPDLEGAGAGERI